MPVNDDHLTPQVRLEQLAELLSRGVLRWHESRVHGDALPVHNSLRNDSRATRFPNR